MAQPTYTQVRAALANTLTVQIPGLRASANRAAQVNPPAAVVMPVTGSFAAYSQDFSGSLKFTLRVFVLVAEGDSSSGMDNLDPYIASVGPQSIWAAVQADTKLGGTVQDAFVAEATTYGLMQWMGVDYLAAQFLVQVMI